MRASILAIATLLQASTAQAERFAVTCIGTSYTENNFAGPAPETRDALPQQVYVIDEDNKTVQRALLPRQQFDDLCPSSESDPSVDISPGLIRVTSAPDLSENSIDCSFELDRQTGKALFKLDMKFPGDRYNRLRWEMMCGKTAIPVFNLRKNKF